MRAAIKIDKVLLRRDIAVVVAERGDGNLQGFWAFKCEKNLEHEIYNYQKKHYIKILLDILRFMICHMLCKLGRKS